jgi:hypothetical protein
LILDGQTGRGGGAALGLFPVRILRFGYVARNLVDDDRYPVKDGKGVLATEQLLIGYAGGGGGA